MNEGQKFEALKGIDVNEKPGPVVVAHQVTKEIENEIDLSYFYLNNEAFINLLAPLEVNDLLRIKTLNLTANVIDDDAIGELCDRLLNIHNTSMEHLILEETQVTDKGIKNLIDTMTRIVSIWDVQCNSL